MMGFFALCFFRWFGWCLTQDKVTVLTINYDNGFCGAGLLGSCLKLLDAILPWNLMQYEVCYVVTVVGTILYHALLIAVVCTFLKLYQGRGKSSLMLLGLLVVGMPMFLSSGSFGAVEMYFMILVWSCLLLMLWERVLFLVPLLCGLGMLISGEFFFEALPIVLSILWLTYCLKENESCRKMFWTTLLLCMVLLVITEIANTQSMDFRADEMFSLGKMLADPQYEYKESRVAYGLLTQSVFANEKAFAKAFTATDILRGMLALSYFGLLARLLYQKSKLGRVRRAMYAVILCLPLVTVIPLFFKIDYGMMAYSMAICCLLSGIYLEGCLGESEKRAYGMGEWLWLICPLLLMPF